MKALLVYNTALYLFRFRRELIAALQREGMEVVAVVPLSDPACAQLRAIGIRCVDLPMSAHSTNPLRELLTLVSLYRVFVAEKPRLVFNFTVKPVIYGSIAASLARVPVIASMITGMGYLFSDAGRTRSVLISAVKRLYHYALSKNRVVFFQNPDDLSLFVSQSLVRQDVAALINGSGVNLSEFEPPSQRSEGVTFLLIARLIWDKGVGDFAEAAKSLKRHYTNVQFWLVGPFDTNPSAVPESEIRRWEAEGTIKYFGELADVRGVLRDASVFVLPSYYPEGVPRTILEAMAAGLPIVTTDVPGCRETVVDGRNGYLVPPRDPSVLADRMRRFLDSPALALEMGRASRQIAEAKFDVRDVVRKILFHLDLQHP